MATTRSARLILAPAITLETVAVATNVVMLFENLPPGLDLADNAAGAQVSLGQLARRFA